MRSALTNGKMINWRSWLAVVLLVVPVLLFCAGVAGASSSAIPFQPGVDLVNDLIGAHSVRSADLDQDGDLDIITVGRNSGEVMWLENQGGTPPQFVRHTIDIVEGVYAAYPADINRDGAVDIVATGVGTLKPALQASSAPTGGSAVVWFENKLRTTSSFVRNTISTDLNYPVAIYPTDLDHDGDLDVLAAARDANSITWFENNGALPPGFTAHLIANDTIAAVAVHAADIDGDGDMDVVSASEDDNKIAWYTNDGNKPPNFTEHVIRQFAPPDPKKDYAKTVFAADVDRDHDVDIVYGSEDNNQVGWLENLGGATSFTDHPLANDTDHTKAVYSTDVDNDGDMDVLAASSDDHRITWLENTGGAPPAFSLQNITVNAAGAHSVYAADLDRDGDPDILSASRDDNRVTWYPNQMIHRSAFYLEQKQSVIARIAEPRSVYAVDLDGDGDMDVLSVSESSVIWYESNGALPPTFTRRAISNGLIGGRWVYSADLDGDGDMDVLAAAKDSNLIVWYENRGGTPLAFAGHIVTQQALGVRAVLAADLDHDGDMDLYSASDTDNVIAWFENTGTPLPGFVRHVVTNRADYARSVYAADLDGDGDLDLMSASQADDTVRWYENNGARPAVFTTRVVATNIDGVQHIHADDIDHDGDKDLITASEFDNSIRWFENVGGSPPSFVPHIVTANATAVHAVYTGDADGDGDVDIFAAIEKRNTIAWYENDGAISPSFTEHVIVNNALTAHGIYAADMDKDGDLDVLAASRSDGKVAWYENLGGQYALQAGTSRQPANVALQLIATHRGRAGDSNLELATLDFALTDKSGNPLDSAHANTLIQKLDIYRMAVCCDQAFDASRDTLVASIFPLELDAAGHQVINFLDGDANLQIGVGAPVAYAVVAQINASTCPGAMSLFRVTNVLRPGGMQDSATDLPLLAESMRSLTSEEVVDVKEQSVLHINELMAGGNTTFPDPDDPGEYPDWFELHNSSANPIDLGGKYLTDDLTLPTKYRIPDGVVIAPNSYLVFFADGEPIQGPLHTNFRLSHLGESLALFNDDNASNTLIDSYTYPEQSLGQSTGRFPDNSSNWITLGTPTPGSSNINFVATTKLYLPAINVFPLCQ